MLNQLALPENAASDEDTRVVFRSKTTGGISAAIMEFTDEGGQIALILHYAHINNLEVLVTALSEALETYKEDQIHVLLYEIWTQPKEGEYKTDAMRLLCGELYELCIIDVSPERSLSHCAEVISRISCEYYKNLIVH